MSTELIELGGVRSNPMYPSWMYGAKKRNLGGLGEDFSDRFTGGLKTVGSWIGLDKLSDSLGSTFNLSPCQVYGLQTGLFIGVPSAVLFGLGNFGYGVPFIGRYVGKLGFGLIVIGGAGLAYSIYTMIKSWNACPPKQGDDEYYAEMESLRSQIDPGLWDQIQTKELANDLFLIKGCFVDKFAGQTRYQWKDFIIDVTAAWKKCVETRSWGFANLGAVPAGSIPSDIVNTGEDRPFLSNDIYNNLMLVAESFEGQKCFEQRSAEIMWVLKDAVYSKLAGAWFLPNQMFHAFDLLGYR